MGVDLIGEWWRAWEGPREVGQKRRREWLERRFGLVGASWVGLMRARVARLTFEPDPDGDRTLMVMLVVEDPKKTWPPAPDLLADLVAWDPRDPTSWWVRIGNCDWMGEWALVWANGYALIGLEKPDLRLCATPESWLREVAAGGDPVCRLTDVVKGEWRSMLWGVYMVICDSEIQAAALNKVLRARVVNAVPKLGFVTPGEVAT